MAIFHTIACFSIISLTLIACGVPADQIHLAPDLRTSTWELSRWDGSPEGIALIEYLNSSDTTEEVLDHHVGLDSRAAGNLIGHRNGGDQRFNTTDDDLFESVQEVDDVRWVGPRTIEKMIQFIEDMELIPAYEEFLGTWDGVGFTVAQAEATLNFTNEASEELLDEDLNLDRRAVNSIIEARPIGTIAHLASLYYVGKRALTTLRNAADQNRND